MYEELIKSLRTHGFLYDSKLAVSAADAIEELSASVAGYEAATDVEFVKEDGHERIRFVPKWIPVTEQLPEIKEHHVSDPVLVYLSDGGMSFSELEENCFGQVWFDIERPRPDGDSEYIVTHWMPLPEPPKEETE